MHDTTMLLIELGAILLGLGLTGRFAGRFGLSPVPLYLLVGLAFGSGGLLPLSASGDFVAVGADIGVILLLLMLGLEYSASELVDSLCTQYPSGAVDFVLNALPGAGAALLLGWGPVGAVALGGVTWISSSGVIAKVLADLGRLGNRETPVVLGVLVIEDLSMALYLPLLTALLAGLGLAGGGIALIISLGTVAIVLYVALRHGRLVSRAVSSDNPEMLLLVVLGLTLLVAGVAQELQVSAAVGAFLVGIALSGEVAEGARKILAPLRDLFAAVFFVFFGLSTDPNAIPPVLLTALALAAATTLTKIATGWYAARRAAIGPRGRWRAGGTLVARGEFSIVIAGLASAAEPRIGPLAAAYVLILVFVGPLATRWSEPLASWLLRRPQDDRVAGPAGDRPTGAVGNTAPDPPAGRPVGPEAGTRAGATSDAAGDRPVGPEAGTRAGATSDAAGDRPAGPTGGRPTGAPADQTPDRPPDTPARPAADASADPTGGPEADTPAGPAPGAAADPTRGPEADTPDSLAPGARANETAYRPTGTPAGPAAGAPAGPTPDPETDAWADPATGTAADQTTDRPTGTSADPTAGPEGGAPEEIARWTSERRRRDDRP